MKEMDVISVTSQLYVLFLRSIYIQVRANTKYSKWKLRLPNKFQAIRLKKLNYFIIIFLV